MKKRKWGILSVFLLLLAACDPLTMTSRGKELLGTYVLTTQSEFGSWTEIYSVSETSVTYKGGVDEKSAETVYTGTVRKVVFDRFNGEETQPAMNLPEGTGYGHFGYMILELTECNNEGTGRPGMFNVFRFGQKKDGTWVFTQGYKNGSSDENVYINRLFGTAEEAEREITAKNGYFGYASTGFRKQKQ
ncbi:MAG: hypothetical protein SOZ27_04385 [Spirochaetia bacterium]|nr:hypothetical protein [Spirochaetia bacterium]